MKPGRDYLIKRAREYVAIMQSPTLDDLYRYNAPDIRADRPGGVYRLEDVQAGLVDHLSVKLSAIERALMERHGMSLDEVRGAIYG